MPPTRWALCGNPAAWAISAALIDRIPDAQEKTTARPSGSGRSAGSKVDSGARTEPGIRSIAVSLGSRTSTSRISPAARPFATSSGVRSRISPPPNRPYIPASLSMPVGEPASASPTKSLHGHLRADLDHPAGRNLEIVGRVVGGAGERDEQTILPGRHARARRRLERPARQEERGRHDVELPAELARDCERLGHVRRLHVAEPDGQAREGVADQL